MHVECRVIVLFFVRKSELNAVLLVWYLFVLLIFWFALVFVIDVLKDLKLRISFVSAV